MVIHGKMVIKLAKTAPIPRVTNKAGNAQQISVPKLVNKVRIGDNISLFFNTIN